jgi:hypothetical protein
MVPDLSGWWCSEERVFPGRERQDERSNLPFPGQGWEGLGSALTGRYARRSANPEDAPEPTFDTPQGQLRTLRSTPSDSKRRITVENSWIDAQVAECLAQNDVRVIKAYSSPPRKRGSRAAVRALDAWIPAFAGMTSNLQAEHNSFRVRL